MRQEYTREQLIDLCDRAVVDESLWDNRDTATAQRQLGEARQLLKAGCKFETLYEQGSGLCTDADTVWIEITYKGFMDVEEGREATYTDTFYLPTERRLKQKGDWY